MDELPKVEGLEPEQALARLGGNRALYLKLLHQFLDQESVPLQLAERLNQGDRASAERMAHTLKGVAGTVGAVEVRQAAAAAEAAIRSHQDAAVERLKACLSELLARLRLALPPLASDRQELKPREEVLAQMDELLGCFDTGAQELFESQREVFQAVLSAEDFRAFESHLGSFALEEAHELLRQAISS